MTAAPFRRAHPLLATACLAAAASCAGSVRFDGTRFHKRDVDYEIGALSPGWERVKVEGNDLAFSQAGFGTIAVNATCRDYDDVPREALLNHLLFGTTARQFVLEEDVTVDGRGARHAVVKAELDGVPVRLDLYVLVRSGCVFDLSYVSGLDAPGQDSFERFVAAFHVRAVHRGGSS